MPSSSAVLIFTSGLIIFAFLKIQYQFGIKKDFYKITVLLGIWVNWLIFTGQSGVLSHFEKTPPPFLFFFPVLILFSVFLAFSKYGTLILQNVSLSGLVLFHGFRILAETVLYLAMAEGLAPIQMTFEGKNFDIVTGVSALALGLYLRKNLQLKLTLAFNLMGLVFLAIIAFIAVTSMPSALRIFMNEPSNIWVTQSPYILLPGVLVTAALTGHWLIFRKIKSLKTAVSN